MNGALEIPELRQALEDVGELRAKVDRLAGRLEAAERALESGMSKPDEETPIIGLPAIARALGLKSSKTLRRWAERLELAEAHSLPMLLKKTPSGRWMTTRRLILNWSQATATSPWTLDEKTVKRVTHHG